MILTAALTVFLASCQPSPSRPQPAAPSGESEMPLAGPLASSDPCAEQLHDLSGALLGWYAQHDGLPNSLDDLKTFPGLSNLQYFCPVSGQPYVYDPEGFTVPGKPGIVVVYDPEPSHSLLHLAISIIPPLENKAMNTRLLALTRVELREALKLRARKAAPPVRQE